MNRHAVVLDALMTAGGIRYDLIQNESANTLMGYDHKNTLPEVVIRLDGVNLPPYRACRESTQTP